MQMVQLAEFLPLVRPYALNVPEPVAEYHLRLAAIEFCERTRAWRHILNVSMTSSDKAVVAPYGATIHDFEYARFNGEHLEPVQFANMQVEEEAGQVAQPRYITQISPGTVRVIPFEAGTLNLSVFLKPVNGHKYGGNPEDPLEDRLNSVPRFFYEQHAEPLAHGALARILSLPDQPFSEPQMAAVYRVSFDAYLDRQFSANMRGQHRAPRRTRYHDF